MTVAAATPDDGRGYPFKRRKPVPRDDLQPSGRQRAYIARLCLELLGMPYPANRREAAELIDLLRGQLGAQPNATTQDIPF